MKHALDFIMNHLNFMEVQTKRTKEPFVGLLFFERKELKDIIRKCEYLLKLDKSLKAKADNKANEMKLDNGTVINVDHFDMITANYRNQIYWLRFNNSDKEILINSEEFERLKDKLHGKERK